MPREGRIWYERISERAGQMCERCGQRIGDSVHHRKKRSQGGKWTWENLVFLCGTGTTGCHGWVEHNPNDAEWEGFHVRPWQDPADIAVKYQGEWAYLISDGGIKFDESRDVSQRDQLPTQGQARRAVREGAGVRAYLARHTRFRHQPGPSIR